MDVGRGSGELRDHLSLQLALRPMADPKEDEERISDWFTEQQSVWRDLELRAKNPITRGFARLMHRWSSGGADEYRERLEEDSPELDPPTR